MSVMVCLALISGYAAGVAIALFLLPTPVVEPVIARLLTAGAVVGTGIALFLWSRRSGPPVAPAAIPGAAPAMAAAEMAEPGVGEADEDDIIGDPAVLELLGRRLADPLARLPDGSLGPKELRQVLYDGRVELHPTPILALPERSEAFRLVRPMLRDNGGVEVPPRHYVRTVARCGLGPLLDRVVVIRTLQTLIADGSGGTIACGVGADNLTSALLLDGLEEFLRDHPGLGQRLVLEVDSLPRRAAAGPAIRRLARHGIRFCLQRLSTAPLDLDRLRELGFTFVRLAAPRFAVVPELAGAVPQLAALTESVRRAELTLVVGRADRASTPHEGGEASAEEPLHDPLVREDAA